MTILILDNSTEAIAKSLDDKSLDKMIKSIAQTLCNVHWLNLTITSFTNCNVDPEYIFKYQFIRDRIPMQQKNLKDNDKFSKWVHYSVGNYEWMSQTGYALCREYHFRKNDKCKADMKSFDDQWDCGAHHKLKAAIEWARDNVPELPNGSITPFPIVVPDRFISSCVNENPIYALKCGLELTIESYRNYYNHLLSKELKRKVKCKNCEDGLIRDSAVKCVGCCDPFTSCNKCYGKGSLSKPIIPTWTRREKPEWVRLENEG